MTSRVLVVDDEQSLAKVVASYLERDGHQVNCVFDPARWPAQDGRQRRTRHRRDVHPINLHSAAIGPS
jgi:DNA-binding response OmpR family regulator